MLLFINDALILRIFVISHYSVSSASCDVRFICYSSCGWYHFRVANSLLININICSHIPQTKISLPSRWCLEFTWTSVIGPLDSNLESLSLLTLTWPHPWSNYLDSSVNNLHWPRLIRVNITRYYIALRVKTDTVITILRGFIYRVVYNQRITA